MRKLVSLLILTTLLSACSLLGGANTPKDGDTVSVHYVGTQDDGTEFDSSRREGRSPLQFVIGSGNMIKGFEDAVRTMQVGKTKKVRLEAKDAYGEEYIERTMPLSEYKEVVSQTVPANALTGKLEQKVPKEQAQNLFGSIDVGTEKKIGEATLKVLSVEGDEVLVSINDPKAPFYGKVPAVGMETVAQDGSNIKITKVEGENVTLDIKQQQEVISKDDKNITVKVKNPHPLAGKALNFDIELLEIKSPAPVATDDAMAPADGAAMENTQN